MNARDVMTSDVVSVRPELPAQQIAQLLLGKGISAVPVIDETGALLGMVSEGDLIGRGETERETRRDWWLALLADGGTRNPNDVAGQPFGQWTARDIMAAPVVTVAEDTDVGEIARLLATYRIKRVPVVREGRVVGIVSRADLLRALAQEPPPTAATSRPGGFLAAAFAGLDERFGHGRQAEQSKPSAATAEPDESRVKATDFRHLAADFADTELQQREQARKMAAEQRRQRVTELIDRHMSDEGWRALVHRAREAAEHGQTEFMLLRFPSQLLSDGGRAINVSEADWPATLRGEAAELYLRWERDLKPQGFRLAARVLEFPGGKPGDVGLSLTWGQ